MSEAPDQNVPGSGTATRADRGSSINNVTVNLGSQTIAVAVGLAVIIGACGVMMGIDIVERSVQAHNYDLLERQYRMVELKLDDWTVVAHRSGLVLPGDYTRGPQGNLDAESFKQEKEDGSRRSNTESKGVAGRGH